MRMLQDFLAAFVGAKTVPKERVFAKLRTQPQYSQRFLQAKECMADVLTLFKLLRTLRKLLAAEKKPVLLVLRLQPHDL